MFKNRCNSFDFHVRKSGANFELGHLLLYGILLFIINKNYKDTK